MIAVALEGLVLGEHDRKDALSQGFVGCAVGELVEGARDEGQDLLLEVALGDDIGNLLGQRRVGKQVGAKLLAQLCDSVLDDGGIHVGKCLCDASSAFGLTA